LALGYEAMALEQASKVWGGAFSADVKGWAGGTRARILLGRGNVDESLDTAKQALDLHARVTLLGDASVRRTREEAEQAMTS
jgi:hypothetical protein